MKYRGAQESEAHRCLKGLIERSLRADPAFSDVRIEATWRASEGTHGLRRPDVQARVGSQRVAFEAQLTTTFLDVVVERKRFYRAEGALLVWVLRHFEPSYRQLTVDDVLFNNNSNVLVIDANSARASEERGCLLFRCWYRRPKLQAKTIVWCWEKRLVSWDELHIDVLEQRVFWFDCEAEERALKAKSDNYLRDRLFDAVLNDSADAAFLANWREVRAEFSTMGILLRGNFGPELAVRDLVRGVLSARAGKPVGYGFRNLIEVAHRLYEQSKPALLPFWYTLQEVGRTNLLKEQDKSGLWRPKAEATRAAIKSNDLDFQLDQSQAGLLKFLFPEIGTRLNN